MATLTKKQHDLWNSKCKNGFTFDVKRYLVWSEKQIHKYIDLPNGDKLEATIYYTDEYDRYRFTGVRPVLHLQLWHPDGAFMRSSGIGKTISLGEIQEKRMFNQLCALSGTITDETIMANARACWNRLNDPNVFPATA